MPEHLTDHQGLRTAEHFRNHELTHHRDKHQHGARDDAVLGQRHGDLPEAGDAARAKVGRRFQQAEVVLDQVGVERQNHKRQVRVNDTDIHRQVGVEDHQRLIDQTDAHQGTVEQTVVAEDTHPGVHADQDRRPGRHHDQQHEHRLHFLAGAGDGIGHRIADQQTQQGADQGHLQRAEVGGDIQLVAHQHHVVTQVQQDLQLLVHVAVDFGVRRNGHIGFGEADLQHDGKRQHEEHEQPEKRHADHDVPAFRHEESRLQFHERSTTPLSSSQQTNTLSPQVGRVPRRSALATKDCTIMPLGSSTWNTEWPPR